MSAPLYISMHTRRSRIFFLATVTLFSTLAVAHADNTAAVRKPISKPVDFFWRAVYRESTSPYDVLVTIVDDRSGKARNVCIEEPFLEGAEHTELKLGYSRSDQKKIKALIYANKFHIYHFSNPNALSNVEPRYTEAQLSTMRQRLSTYTDADLPHGFGTKNRFDIIQKGEDFDAMEMAAGHILMEHGFQVRNPDFFFGVVIETFEQAQASDLREEQIKAEFDSSKRKGMSFARSLPGYAQAVHLFSIDVDYGNVNSEPLSMFVTLTSRHRGVITTAWWFDKIVDGKPRYNWTQFLSLFRSAERVARRSHWLGSWSRAHKSEEVRLVVSGSHAWCSDLDDGAMTAWRRAGFADSPKFQFTLGSNHTGYAEVYFDGTGTNFLINDFTYIDPNDPHSGPVIVPRTAIDRSTLGYRSVGQNYFILTNHSRPPGK